MKLMFFLLPVMFLGCASKSMLAAPEVGKEVPAPQNSVCLNNTVPTGLAAIGGRLDILTSSNLTKEQKTQFMDLMNETHHKVTSIKQKEGDIKSELFRSLAEGVYNRKLADSSKEKLVKLEKEKMNLMFSSLDKARSILGTNTKLDPEIFRGYHNNLLF